MSDELKPCPFCGSENLKTNTSEFNHDFIQCCDCGGDGPLEDHSETAEGYWNRRAPAQGELSALPERWSETFARCVRPANMTDQEWRTRCMLDEIKALRAYGLLCRQQGGSDAARLSGLTRYEEYGNESGGGLQEAADGDFVRLDDVFAAIQAQAGEAGGCDRG